MITFCLGLILYWCAIVCAIYLLPGQRLRNAAGWSILALYLLFLFLSVADFNSLERLVLSTIGLLLSIKASALLLRSRDEIRSFSLVGMGLYLSIWPGLDPQPFKARQEFSVQFETRFVPGYFRLMVGLLTCLGIAFLEPSMGTELIGWAGLFALGLTVHFGYTDVLSSLMQLGGWNIRPLFEHPMRSTTLREFWSRRWNIAFVEMNKTLFLPLLSKLVRNKALTLTMVFLISGLLHEIAISYSSGGRPGLPTLYFLLQALVLLGQDKLANSRISPYAMRTLTLLCIIVPLPILFTTSFRSEFIVPLFQYLHNELVRHDASWYFSIALWIAAAGNFCAIAAGIQLPYRLNWREELARLSSFNRKIFINYYFYIGLMVLTWGSLTIVLHDDMLRGDRTSLILTGVIAVFWTLRLIVDLFYFKHSDWPKGAQFVVGHALLTTLFVFLAFSYLGLIFWQAFRA